MRTLLTCFFAAILAAMLWVTITASMDRSVFEAGAEIWADPWGRATLFDAYFGFLTVFVWIAYREPTWARRAAWLIALLLLGNIAIAVYFLIALAGRGTRDWTDLFRPVQPKPVGGGR